MTSNNSFAWETSKENAAPLARGRSVHHYEQPVMSSRDKAEGIGRFEQRIVDEARSASPLAPWIEYIKWHEDRFPSEIHAQFVLIERCFLAFQSDPRFHHDIRYIRLCCLYADKTQEPCQTFREIHRAGIGRDSAVFWNAWAFVAEKSGDFRLADRIYRHAVEEVRAEPLPYLLQRRKHFQKRLAKHFLESLENPGDTNGEEEEHQRSIFGSVSVVAGSSRAARPTSSMTFTDRSTQLTASRATTGTRENNPPNTSQASFTIYGDQHSSCDDSLLDSRIASVEREPEAQRWKENRGPRERWNDRTHGPSLPIIQTSAFSVYVDEQCAAENTRKEEQRLSKEEEHRQTRRGLAAAGEDGGDKKQFKPAWKKSLLKDSSGEERCFEEARMEAGCFRLVGAAANLNLIAPETSSDNDDSSMSICGSDDDSVVYDETTVLDKRLLDMIQPKVAIRPTDSDPAPRMVDRNPPETVPTSSSLNPNVSGIRLPTPIVTTRPVDSDPAPRMVDRNPPETIPTNSSWNLNVSGIRLPTPIVTTRPADSDPAPRMVDRNPPETIPTNLSWSSNASGIRLPTPTANMQYAMDQVSMMFSSPMVGDGMEENPPELLILDDSPAIERENIFRRRYPDARSLPEAEAHVLNNLRQEDEADRSTLGCRRPTDRRRIGTLHQDNPMAGLQEHHLPSNAGFSVYEDNEECNATVNTTLGASNRVPPNPVFTVYHDVESLSERLPVRIGTASNSGFTIFQDETEPTHHNRAPLSILRETVAQETSTADSDSVTSDDLNMFGGAAGAGEPTITSNEFDRLTLATTRSTAARVSTLPPFDDISTIEHEDQTAEIPTVRSSSHPQR